MDGADGARLATVVYRWRDLGASGDRLEFLIGMSEGYEGGSSKHWTRIGFSRKLRTRFVESLTNGLTQLTGLNPGRNTHASG
jgi:hypothetical protein